MGKVLPDWLLVISLVILLAQTTYTTLLKAKQQYEKESQAIEKLRKSALTTTIDEEVELSEKVGLLDSGMAEGDHENVSNEPPELRSLLEEERITPTDKVAILTIMVLVTCGLNMLKGGGGSFQSPLGIKCGSSSYWAVTALTLSWVLGISFWMRSVLISKWRMKSRLGYRYTAGDVEWNETNTLVYPALCFFAGFFAGMFGVGGGIVKGPLMLQMGVHPLVASGTVAVMIMFTSVAATAMFVAFGTLTWDYAWFLFIVGLVTTSIGQFGVSFLVEKYKRYSFISMSIGAVVAISTVLMAVQSVLSLSDAAASGSSSTSTLCGK